MGRGGGEQDCDPIEEPTITAEDIAAVEKAYRLMSARAAYDREAWAEIREKRSGDSKTIYQAYRDVVEELTEADVSTFGSVLEKLSYWQQEEE